MDQSEVQEPERIRLDSALSLTYEDLSRATIQKLIKNGYVKVDATFITKPSFIVDGTEKIDINLERLEQPDNSLALEVLYEDENCVVINKPSGILSHSKGVFNPEETVASWLTTREHYNFPDQNERSGIVHRLDRATSGVIICAKNPHTHGFLQKQFQDRAVKKTYRAAVEGVFDPPEAILNLPLARNPKSPHMFKVDPGGKASVTHYRQIGTDGKHSYVELYPETGRTHQLRVHMAYVNHPILGDPLYGNPKTAPRLMLHAYGLEITIPGGVRKTFTAPVPKGFAL